MAQCMSFMIFSGVLTHSLKKDRVPALNEIMYVKGLSQRKALEVLGVKEPTKWNNGQECVNSNDKWGKGKLKVEWIKYQQLKKSQCHLELLSAHLAWQMLPGALKSNAPPYVLNSSSLELVPITHHRPPHHPPLLSHCILLPCYFLHRTKLICNDLYACLLSAVTLHFEMGTSSILLNCILINTVPTRHAIVLEWMSDHKERSKKAF